MSGREVLQDGCKTCYDVLFGDGGTNKKTGGAGGSGRVDQEDSSCLAVWGKSKVKVVWTCGEEEQWTYY